jgi:hypothetical protein
LRHVHNRLSPVRVGCRLRARGQSIEMNLLLFFIGSRCLQGHFAECGDKDRIARRWSSNDFG